MINVNEYFDGNVKSLGYENAAGKSSVGVMAPGEYTFGTAAPEIMTVVEGSMEIKLKGEREWKTYKAGETFTVVGDSSFDLKITENTSYLCQYR